MLSVFFFYGGLGMFFLRVALGALLLVHGWPKLKYLKRTAANFGKMGFRPGAFWGTIVALLEFFGGIALILGFFTQTVAMLFVLEFAVIVVWKLVKREPFAGGWELDLLILAALLVLLWNGSGSYSLDRVFLIGW